MNRRRRREKFMLIKIKGWKGRDAMNLIVAVDKNWGIGFQKQMLVSIPADMRFFREETNGKVVVMGRKTYESLPAGQPLTNRNNIILTREKDYKVKDATILHSIEELLFELEKYNTKDIYIIGGQTIYEQMLSYCDVAHVTKIDFSYQADTFCPNLDEHEEWKMTASSEEQTYYDLEYMFCKYERVK